jgi:hypothetical protein
VPGLGESKAVLYEDDGESQAYGSEYALTEVFKKAENGKTTVTVAPRKGSFKGMLPERKVTVVLEGTVAPAKVFVNGVEVPYSRYAAYDRGGDKAVWGYDGYELQAKIYLPETSAEEALEVVCLYNEGEDTMIISGQKGVVKRIMTMTPEAKLRFSALKIKNFQLPTEFLNVAQFGSYVNEDPFNADKYLEMLDVQAMIANIESWEKLSADFKTKAVAQTKFEK